MLVPAKLFGASKPFSGKKDPNARYMNVHLVMKSDNPSEGFTTHPSLIDPANYQPGKEPQKFPRDCQCGVQLMSGGGYRITSVVCE